MRRLPERKDRRAKPHLAWWLLLGLLAPVSQAKEGLPLSREHKKWLEEEVVYIISDGEKKVFRNLANDIEREQFIQEFWGLRDPTPGTPRNEYKEEHYRRIEHANRYFGFESGGEGWRTDRGRIYIQLGPPQQRIQHRWLGEIRPLELWFYSQSQHPSLPNAFNVMFYRRDPASDYRLYSPNIDGPDKLVKRTGAENDPQGSYRFLRDFNPEIARASVTLLTDEPVDQENFRPSLASDSMLTRIRNLPNDKFTKEMLERRRRLREMVESRLIFEPSNMEVLAVPLQDSSGESYLHFLLLMPEPLKNMVVQEKKKRYLAATVSVLVQTPEEEKIFQQSHANQFQYAEDYNWKQDLPVGYEDRLPLTPGEYKLDFVFRNELNQVLYRSRLSLKVPAPPANGLHLSPLVVYGDVHRSDGRQQGALPFEFANLKFAPSLRRKFASSEKLSVFFQIKDPSAGPNSAPDEVLKVDYTLGSPARGGPRQSLSQEIPKREFTPYHTVIHGKTFPLSEFPTGSYRLVVQVTDAATRRRTSQTLAFQVVPGSVQTKRVMLINGRFDKDLESGLIDYRRGLCEITANRIEEAIRHLQTAIARNPNLEEARNRLAELYFDGGEFEQVASVFPPRGLNKTTDLASVRRFVTSFERIGNVEKAIEIGERALVRLGPQLVLYEDLVRLYERAGRIGQAQEMQEKARRLRSARRE